MTADLTLVVRRVIRAPRERVFAAWTEPAQIVGWWGPDGVSSPHAAVDLRVGGAYRIDNLLADGTVVSIRGAFHEVVVPERLGYTWCLGGGVEERVIVEFVSVAEGTEVIVRHTRIADPAVRDEHAVGWRGCLEGLQGWLAVS